MVSKRILLVDDDETVLEPFQLILQNEGYLVDTATTGRQAIEKVEKNEYQMAILDIKLPDIKGIDVASKMRDLHCEIRLIIITGYPDLADSIETIDIGI